jgi:predicted secreted hydrolase
MFLFILCACQPDKQGTMLSTLQMVSGASVKRGTELVFPRDHGIHGEQGIEWWYVTANLQTETGKTFGVQWTLFRTLMPSQIESQWWDNNLYFAHFAMQHQQKHVAFERFSRTKQAKITRAPFSAVIDNWQLTSINQAFLPLKLMASQDNYQVELTLSDSPMTLHGDKGFSQKTQSGHASYYFSYPFLAVKGNLTFAGKTYQVTGNAWYDREWSASLLDKGHRGWDWFSLVDTQSTKKGLMLFCIRGEVQNYDYCRGTRIAADGKATDIDPEQIRLSVVETVRLGQGNYPSKWQLELADSSAIFIESVTKDSRNQLTVPYWEGRIKVTGAMEGKGYAELTGY